AWAGPEGTSFVTVEGVAVTVEEGTFTALARVRAQLRPAAEPSIEMPEDLAPLAALALDFGGAEAQKPLGLRLPGPAPSTAGPYLLNRIVEVLGRGGWMIHDLLRWEAGAYTNEPAPPGGGALTAPSVDAKGLKTGSAGDYVTGALFAGEYQLVEPLVPMSFVAAPYFAADVAFFSSWEGFVTQVSAAVARILPGAVLLPIRAGAPYALELVDLTTGFTSFADTLPAPAGALEVLPQDAYGDILAPYPTGGSPLRFYVVGAEESLPAEVAARITRGVAGGALTITGAAGATQQGAAIRLLGLDDAASVSATAAADGSFTVTTPANAGNRYVLAIGARVSSGVALEIAFNEALAIPPVGIEVKEGTRTVPVEVKPLGVGSRVRLRPAAGWLSGRSYTLRLTPALADQVGNAWSKTLEVPFEVVGGSVSGGIATGAARDSARLGNLLFVAADSQGLVVLDAGDPDNLKNYLPNGGALPLALADPVRGVAVDPHGRVTFVGGGTTGFGQLKILDPLAIDVAAIAADPTNDALLQAAIRGSTLLTDQVGGTNTQLPDGLPRRVAVLPNDAVRSWRWGEAAPADLVLSPAQPPAHQEVTLTVSGTSGTPGQPVTLHNLTRGTWSRVDATTGGSFSISMTAGAGEALELRENRGSVAYVTIDGYGLMAVALAKVYDEDLDSPALASAALRDYTNLPVSDPCPSSGWVPFRPVDVEIVPGAGQPLTLAVLNQA
ncbi:MAG TPA: Ig-like domain-containing protein, partial [Thermoanaerobaculia bacterium]